MTFLKSSALALVLGGAMLGGGCTMDRDSDRGMDRHMAGGVAMDYDTVAYGYSDGYWTTDHQWHAWNNDNDMAMYRNRTGNHYHDWKHDRDGNNGWMGQ